MQMHCIYFLFVLATKFLASDSHLPRVNETAVPRVVRGFQCSTEEYPFLVLVALQPEDDTSKWERLCGGSLVNAVWVLTAAHCVMEENAIFGVLAAINQPSKKTILALVEKIVIHPMFDETDLSFDVGLVKLERPLQKSSHIDYVKLPTARNTPSGIPCSTGLVMGWGRTETAIPELDHLQCAIVPLISNNQCRTLYLMHHGLMVNEKHLCTLSTEGIDACEGDSGGPLLCNSVQVGIVSWGVDCGKETNPGVYSRIDNYLDFILLTTSETYSDATCHSIMFLYLGFTAFWFVM